MCADLDISLVLYHVKNMNGKNEEKDDEYNHGTLQHQAQEKEG